MRNYGLILAAALSALAIGYWAGRSSSPAASVNARDAQGAVAQKSSTAGASPSAAPKSGARKLTPAVSGVASVSASRTSAPLPPPGTPLKDIRADLEARAQAGDAEAASRLFRDTQRCADMRRINSTVPRMAQRALDQKTDGLSAEALRSREKVLANYDKQLSFARDNMALCEGLSDEDTTQVVPSALQAALLGDVLAADCYIGTGMFGAPRGLIDHPEWLTNYKNNALAIANTAVDRGDWQMVAILGTAYNANVFNTLLGQVTGNDSVQAYRYLKLRSLGSSGNRNQDYFNNTLATLGSEISADAKAAGDAWAQQIFQTAFNATPPTTPLSPGINIGNACRSEGL